MRYTGLSKCKIDASGRIKLPQKVIDDLQVDLGDDNAVVLYCLPEGGLALFSETTWDLMRSKATEQTPDLLNDEELRRRSRRIAANTDSTLLTPQGRITIPTLFREKLGFTDTQDLIITGNERGFEIWTADSWLQESQRMNDN